MTPSIAVVLERDNVNDESVTLVRWIARHGDQVSAGDLLAEVETSKANLEVYSPAAGYLVWEFPEGGDVPVTAPIGRIVAEVPAEPPRYGAARVVASGAAVASVPAKSPNGNYSIAAAPAHAQAAASAEFLPVTAYRQRISPLAAKMMAEHGLTAKDFAGKSAVSKRDVLELLHPPAAKPEPAQADTAAPITQPHQRVALSKMKKREGSALRTGVANAVSSAVSVTCFTRGLRRIVEARVPGGSASALIVYEVSRLLRKYPTLNATYRDGAMIQYDQVNLGFAMDDGRGLKVAVLSDCDALSLMEITEQIRELTLAYLDDKLTPVQIANGTFTISDLSGLGIASFLPLISENQGGILGVGGEQFAPGSAYGFYSLTLTFDHQLTNGRTAALFLNDLKDHLQHYEAAGQEASKQLDCAQCGRTAAELAKTDHHLLQSATQEGYLCTLCAVGY